MTLLPLDQIRLDARSHGAALRWIGLAYRRPKEVKAAEKHLRPWERVAACLRIYAHALPYLALVCGLGRWVLTVFFGVRTDHGLLSRLMEGVGLQGHEFTFALITGLCSGLALGLAFCVDSALAGLAAGLGFGLALGTGFNLDYIALSLSVSFFGGLAVSIGIERTGDLASTLGAAIFIVCTAIIAVDLTINRGFSLGLAFGLTFVFFFFRLYYILFYFLWLRSRVLKEYRLHPVAWDDQCLLPVPGLDLALVAYAERDPAAGKREIDRLIDEYVSQRGAALRAQATLIARRAAKIEDLTRLDESLVSLPEGKGGFLAETHELRSRVHQISLLQTRLDTLDRPFLREPFEGRMPSCEDKMTPFELGLSPSEERCSPSHSRARDPAPRLESTRKRPARPRLGSGSSPPPPATGTPGSSGCMSLRRSAACLWGGWSVRR